MLGLIRVLQLVYDVDIKNVGRRSFGERIKLRDDVDFMMKSGGFSGLKLRDNAYRKGVIAGDVKHQRPFFGFATSLNPP